MATTATVRVKGSIAPDGKDAQAVVYDFDLEVSLPLRELFAGLALAGLVGCGFKPEDVASRAVAYADAVVAAARHS